MLAWAKTLFEAPSFNAEKSFVVLTARVSPALLDRWVARASVMNHGFLWAPGDLARSRDAWTLAGHGATLELTAKGSTRWDHVREEARRAFDRVDQVAHAGTIAPPLRFFGGASFHPSSKLEPDAVWAGFGEASFVLPRWLYGVHDGDAFLQFAFRREELASRGHLLAEIALAENAEPPDVESAASVHAFPPDTSYAVWQTLVDRALEAIHRGAFQKVVVARRSVVAQSISVPASLERLRAQNAESTVFSFTRGGLTFLGASPERLIFLEGNRLATEALAGTIARSEDDEPAKHALLASNKDRREHQIVVDGISAALTPFSSDLDVPSSPKVRTLARVHHLATPIVGHVDRATHVLSLVGALHPTPAVSGLPKLAASEWIAEHEAFERGWYASPAGWFDEKGDGTFAVAIRSALVKSDGALIFAGVGIVDGSEPDAEYRETQLKQKTILSALGSGA